MSGISSLARDHWELVKLKFNPLKAFTPGKPSLDVHGKLESLVDDNFGLKFPKPYLEMEQKLGVHGQKMMPAPSLINLEKRLKRSESVNNLDKCSIRYNFNFNFNFFSILQ